MVVGVASKQARIASASNLFPFNGPKKLSPGSVVDLSATPLLWDGLVLVQDVGRHVVEVLGKSGSNLICCSYHNPTHVMKLAYTN